MKSKFNRIAAMFIFTVGIISLFYVFTPGSSTHSGVAFADVMKHFQGASYQFDVTEINQYGKENNFGVKVLNPGIFRWEPMALGDERKAILIIDLFQMKTLFLLPTSKTAILGDYNPIEENFSAMMTSPIESLWNLQNGGEKRLPAETVNNQLCDGFLITNKREMYPEPWIYEGVQVENYLIKESITVWANHKTGFPVQVDYVVHMNPDPNSFQHFKMHNFTLNASLDMREFQFEPPKGYSLFSGNYHDWSMDQIRQEDIKRQSGMKFVNILKAWSENQKEKSISQFLNEDWRSLYGFPEEARYLILSQSDYLALASEEQEEILREWKEVEKDINELVDVVLQRATRFIEEKDYKQAEQYIHKLYSVSYVLDFRERMLVVRICGRKIKIKMKQAKIELYTAMKETVGLNDMQAAVLKRDHDTLEASQKRLKYLESKLSEYKDDNKVEFR